MSQLSAQEYLTYLQRAAELNNNNKQKSYMLMQIQLGQKVLDVGCGSGIDTVALAHLVGPKGRVLGVDFDKSMIDEADRYAEKSGVDAWVSHKQVKSDALPFESDAFDSCRSERLFQHLEKPAKTLAEMARVTKKGGWVVEIDPDWATLSIDTAEVDIERRLVRFKAEHSLNNGYIGRQLYRLFKQQNFVDILVEALPFYTTNYAVARYIGHLDRVEEAAIDAGVITNQELQRWRANLTEAEAKGVFFASLNLVMIAGRQT